MFTASDGKDVTTKRRHTDDTELQNLSNNQSDCLIKDHIVSGLENMVDSTKANPYIYYPETICTKVKVSVFAAFSNYRFEHKKSNHHTCDNLHFFAH